MTFLNLFLLNLIWLTEPHSRSGISEPIYQNFHYLNSRIKKSELNYKIIDDLNSRFQFSELDSLNLFKLNLIEPPDFVTHKFPAAEGDRQYR